MFTCNMVPMSQIQNQNIPLFFLRCALIALVQLLILLCSLVGFFSPQASLEGGNISIQYLSWLLFKTVHLMFSFLLLFLIKIHCNINKKQNGCVNWKAFSNMAVVLSKKKLKQMSGKYNYVFSLSGFFWFVFFSCINSGFKTQYISLEFWAFFLVFGLFCFVCVCII